MVRREVIFILFVSILASLQLTKGQGRPEVQPPTDKYDCICEQSAAVCKCNFTIEHRLSMVWYDERLLVVPDNGFLRTSGSGGRRLNDTVAKQIITADGEGSRLLIAINTKFPGPRVDVFEDQTVEIIVKNTFHTDSVTIHFHGIHQRNTPWMDGVASITQCPILPGQEFVYRFKAYPPGTSFYHAHIGDQRTMGLYGPFIVRKRDAVPISEIIVSIQDFNHLMDAETTYQRMITEQYNFGTGEKINTTYSVDYGNFSRFEFQSGLVNGKGRYWSPTSNTHNGAPLERFNVKPGTLYRFRAIGAMTLYPMRIYIEGQTLILRSSDCYNLNNISVESIIIHPGERYDFLVRFQTSGSKNVHFLVAETIEVPGSYTGYHAAEAVLDVEGMTYEANPTNSKNLETCTTVARCRIFNCPYVNAGQDIQTCINYNNVTNTDPYRDPSTVLGKKVDLEYFFNFAFPGFPGNTPGSVNGREFLTPTSPLLTQLRNLQTRCTEADCRANTCKCTYIVDIPQNRLVQMVFTNIGNGSGWSHPIHLHGTSFFVMKMGLGTYDATTGRLLRETSDIVCTDRYKFCTQASWSNAAWKLGNLEGLSQQPPLKDTIVVPTGGYVVIRFISSNPGMWFLHCHIDLHNTNGMAMVVNVGQNNQPQAPTGFPHCGNFNYNGEDTANIVCSVQNNKKSGTIRNNASVFIVIFGIWLLHFCIELKIFYNV